MPEPSVPGRSIVTRRALLDVIRTAVIGSYGITGFSDRDPVRRVLRMLGLVRPGIRLTLAPEIGIDVYVTVAHGLPVAEVARQLDSAVRYSVRRAVSRDVARLVVHVNGLRVLPAAATAAAAPSAPSSAPSSADGSSSTSATASAVAESSTSVAPAPAGPEPRSPG